MQINFDLISATIGVIGCVITIILGKKAVIWMKNKRKISAKQKIKIKSSEVQAVQPISAGGDVNITNIKIKDVTIDTDQLQKLEKITSKKLEVIVSPSSQVEKGIEERKAEIKSSLEKDDEKTSVILSKCLDLAKLVKDNSTASWIEKELYRSDEWMSSDITESELRDASDKKIFPEYRSILGKFYIQTKDFVSKEIKIRHFIPFSIFQLEQMIEEAETKGAVKLVLYIPPLKNWVEEFPNIFSNTDTVPVEISLYDLKRIVTEIRMRIHKFIYSK